MRTVAKNKIMLALIAVGALYVHAAEVKIDFDRTVGPVKRVNGVGATGAPAAARPPRTP